MIRQGWLAEATEKLARAGVPDAARDARVLLRWTLDLRAEDLHEALRAAGTASEQAAFQTAIARRATREPLSHITGGRLFWGRRFRVTADVLDPRPETETLVAEALRRGPFERVLDLGTGSGCLLVTLLAEWPDAVGTGVDLSRAALAIAKDNADRHGVSERTAFREDNWVDHLEGSFDLIVSNPPYLAEEELGEVSPEVRDHEPRMALVGGADGLDAYRQIASTARRCLVSGGTMMLEIGPTQGQAVSEILTGNGWSVSGLIADLDERVRVVIARA